MSRPRHENAINILCAYAMLVSKEGRSFVFDHADITLVQQHHWYIGRGGRLCTHVGAKRSTLYLARHLTGAKAKQRVHYLDGDVTNLQRANLLVKNLARRKRRV